MQTRTGTMLAIGECMAEMRNDGAGRYVLGFAGDCFNTAYYFKASSGPEWRTQFYSAVGTDDVSDAMLRFIADTGVDARHVEKVRGRSVGLYTISLNGGERSFNYWRDTSAARDMISRDRLRSALAGADVIYLSGATLAIVGEEGRTLLRSALNEARRSGKRIAFDPNLRPSLWRDADGMTSWTKAIAALSTVVLPSFEDESRTFGDRDPLETVGRYRRYGASHVVVKDGAGPIFLAVDGQTWSIEVQPVEEVVDTTSAGDAFNGVYLARLLQGSPAFEAVRFASLAAGRVVGVHGALVPLSDKIG